VEGESSEGSEDYRYKPGESERICQSNGNSSITLGQGRVLNHISGGRSMFRNITKKMFALFEKFALKNVIFRNSNKKKCSFETQFINPYKCSIDL